jgi:hypothetical protein
MLAALGACKKRDVAVSGGSVAVEKPTPAAVRPGKPEAARPVPLDAGTAESQLQPLKVRTGARPACTEPAPILTEENLKFFNQSYLMPQRWGMVAYQNPSPPDGGRRIPYNRSEIESHLLTLVTLDSNYLSGLEPNRIAGVVNAGLAKAFAIWNKWEYELDDLEPVWFGTFSDHCMPVAANDTTMLFSIKLSASAAVQALVVRDDVATDVTTDLWEEGRRNMPKAMIRGIPAKDRRARYFHTIRLRTVRLPWNGTVLHEGPEMDFFDGIEMGFHLFDDRPETPVVFSIPSPPGRDSITVVSRDGRFIWHMKAPCGDNFTVSVFLERDERGELEMTPHFVGSSSSNCIAGDKLAKINAMINAEAVLKTDGGARD